MAGGVAGQLGTAMGAGGVMNIAHGLGTPTMFGATIETSRQTVAQWSRQVRCRVSGPTLIARYTTGNAGSVGGAVTAVFRWFAAE